MKTIERIAKDQLPFCLDETNFSWLGQKYTGKVRDTYSFEDKRLLVTTDRLSCFDVVLTTVPFKGQVLNQLALYWFEKAKDLVATHVIESPDPNAIIGREAKVLPIEVVVRGYLTGSAWRDYEKGKPVSGITLPQGMMRNQRFDSPLLTPSIKAPAGSHDEPISEEEIVSSGRVHEMLWDKVRNTAMALFAMGTAEAKKHNLILVDTKYEFGTIGNELVLVDEIHTLDSSRYWVANEYENRFLEGQEQIMLDKEPIRQWLISQGYMGEGVPPPFTDDHRVLLSKHYIDSYEQITGQKFVPIAGDTKKRLEESLRKYSLSEKNRVA